MADNVGITPGSGATAAADDIGGVLHQRVKLTLGADGVSDGDVSSSNPIPAQLTTVTSDNPLPVRMDQGPGALVTENGALRVDPTQVNEQAQEVLNATGVHSLGDEPLQMVGLHPSFPLPIDTATPMPIAGRDPVGAVRTLRTDSNGRLQVDADEASNVLTFNYSDTKSASGINIDRIVLNWATDGFQSVVIQAFSAGNGSPQCALEISLDGLNWTTAGITGVRVLDGVLASAIWNNAATGLMLVFAASARYMRLRCTASNAGTIGAWSGTVLLRRQPVSISIPATAAINLSQISAVAVAPATAQLGVNAFGPTAPNSAHSTNNPVQISGSDGTSVRRILTDTSGNTRVVGPLAAGSSLIPQVNAAFAPALMGIADLEGRVQRATGDVRGRQAVTLPDATTTSEAGVIDALNDVVRELKLLNARIADLPYWLGVGAAMPDDASTFRDDPYLFNQ